jgi:hypothetical protein
LPWAACPDFDSPQASRLGFTASRGVRSAEVSHVEKEEKSRKMVGFCSRDRRPGRLTFTRDSGGDSVSPFEPWPGVGAVLAPVWCGADTRRHESCRNNSWGLLLGCHLREHRWQKFKMMFVNRRWQQLNRGLWSSPAEVLATVSGLITIVGVVVAIVRIALGTRVV